ncbi:MAG: hypothetical protein CEN88_467 [Candidatus Berkelbacteria bacterium Licking1014_2]|uniref:Uncharacterized protein n=1 Tax=Candidatus Berkelbacteria bacterium Licking1014_2 TaxID=2017146 RepID=A0A554LRL2_9BACT|nr:MAG: hypothetical protein CEN88_467 [Candidatus Berkelbacteria bacterium Licking1014_2]
MEIWVWRMTKRLRAAFEAALTTVVPPRHSAATNAGVTCWHRREVKASIFCKKREDYQQNYLLIPGEVKKEDVVAAVVGGKNLQVIFRLSYKRMEVEGEVDTEAGKRMEKYDSMGCVRYEETASIPIRIEVFPIPASLAAFLGEDVHEEVGVWWATGEDIVEIQEKYPLVIFVVAS